jgi:predicted transglutaminase-like cysteine proteinase
MERQKAYRGNEMQKTSAVGFKALHKAAAILTLALLSSAPSSPVLAAGKHAPLGYQIMCLRHPEECKGGGAARVSVTNDLMVTLKRVNGQINRQIKPRRDAGPDVWTVGASSGDCEDYALTKRKALIREGVPASSLRIAYVKTRWGEDHAILVVKTSGKDLVLDNLSASIRPLSQTGYRVVSMSGANPLSWS